MLSTKIRVLCLILTHSLVGTTSVECSTLGDLYQSIAANGDVCICTRNEKITSKESPSMGILESPDDFNVFTSGGDIENSPIKESQVEKSIVVEKKIEGIPAAPLPEIVVKEVGNKEDQIETVLAKPEIAIDKNVVRVSTDKIEGILATPKVVIEEIKNKEVQVETASTKPTFDIKDIRVVKEKMIEVDGKPVTTTEVKQVIRENMCIPKPVPKQDNFEIIETAGDITVLPENTPSLSGGQHKASSVSITKTSTVGGTTGIIGTGSGTARKDRTVIYSKNVIGSNTGSSTSIASGSTRMVKGGTTSIIGTAPRPADRSVIYTKNIIGSNSGLSPGSNYDGTLGGYATRRASASTRVVDDIDGGTPYDRTFGYNKHIMGSNRGSSLDLDLGYDGTSNEYAVGRNHYRPRGYRGYGYGGRRGYGRHVGYGYPRSHK